MSKRPKSIADIEGTQSLFPLSGALLLPHTQRPLVVFEARYIDLIDAALAGNRLIGLIQPEDDSVESPSGRDALLRKTGCLGYITQFEEMRDENYMIVLEGVTRFDLLEEVHTDAAFRKACITVSPYAGDFDGRMGEDQVNREKFLTVMRDYAQFADIDFDWAGISNISTSDLVNTCCLLSPYGASEKQVLLEASSLHQRAETLIALAEIEMARAKIGSKLQ